MPTLQRDNYLLNSRPQGGFFVSAILPKQTCTQLTKVNKPVVMICQSISCNDDILPTVKPATFMVNNFGYTFTYSCGKNDNPIRKLSISRS